jgi:hypothetical protein
VESTPNSTILAAEGSWQSKTGIVQQLQAIRFSPTICIQYFSMLFGQMEKIKFHKIYKKKSTISPNSQSYGCRPTKIKKKYIKKKNYKIG